MRPLSPQKKRKIESMTHLTHREIARRCGVSIGAVNSMLGKAGKRSALALGRTPKPTVSKPAATPPDATDVAPDIPEDPPPETSLEEIDAWIGRLRRLAAIAERQENVAASSSLAAKVTGLLALKHRLTPLPPTDPNEDPDFQKGAELGEQRLAQLFAAEAEKMDEERKSWPVCPACSQHIPPEFLK